MALSIRDSRHIFLISLIIAALPMFFYPNSLGFNIGISGWLYFLCEIVFFTAVAFASTQEWTPIRIATKAAIYLAGRILLSLVLTIYLLVMERISLGNAIGDSFINFKPAVFLFTLTAPFIFGSLARAIIDAGAGRRTKGNQERRIIDGTTKPNQGVRPSTDVAQIVPLQSRAGGDYFQRTFDEAVAHVGQYSGVQCSMLIDAEGLTVAAWSRGRFDHEMWGGLARKMVDEIGAICEHGGTSKPETLEFRSGHERFYMQSVADMWLVSIAEAASDELEKIRVIQAVDMVTRLIQERYKNVYMTEAGRLYAGSTV